MSVLVKILDMIAEIDGHIAIRNLTIAQIDALNDKIVWEYNDRKSVEAIIRFGGDYFRPKDVKGGGLKINTGSLQYDYEIKAALLLMVHYGLAEGDDSYKWRTAMAITRGLVRFARYCHQRGQETFRDIDKMPAMKLENLIAGFVSEKKSKGGMDAKAKTSNYRYCHSIFNTLVTYGLISRAGFMELVAKLTVGGAAKHDKESTLKYPIIPTRVMKELITVASAYIERAERNFDEFATLFRQTHEVLRRRKGKKFRDAILESELSHHIKKYLDEYFADLQLHVYSMGLAFTGMRYDEIFSTKTGSVGHREENGKSLYFFRSLLSKTDGNVISLDWVCTEIVYKAVTLLSKINHLYYERAELILKHHADSLTEEQANNLKHGLKDRRLLGVRLSVSSVRFRVHELTPPDEQGYISLEKYHIEVSDADIKELNKMGCNYKSVHGSDRGTPYLVGDDINLTPHQFRHTFAWFIVANRLGDLDDIKYQFKHLTDSMTYIYTQRGFETIDHMERCIEDFNQLLTGQAVDGIIQAAESGLIAGGGGEHITKLIHALNSGSGDKMFSDDQQSHFKSVADLVAFMRVHHDSIRGLPHGYCTKGVNCKIKNLADPSHCLYCDTYYAIPKHLPYWRAIKANCEIKLRRIANLSEDVQKSFQSLKQAVCDNLFAADIIIARLDPSEAKLEVT